MPRKPSWQKKLQKNVRKVQKGIKKAQRKGRKIQRDVRKARNDIAKELGETLPGLRDIGNDAFADAGLGGALGGSGVDLGGFQIGDPDDLGL